MKEVENKSIHFSLTWFLNKTMLNSLLLGLGAEPHLVFKLIAVSVAWLAPSLVSGFGVSCGALLLLMVDLVV